MDGLVRSLAEQEEGAVASVGELAFKFATNTTLRAAFGARSQEDEAEFVAIIRELSQTFLPFGHGRRSCPGMQLGTYALELGLANLLHCFRWSLPDGVAPSDLDVSDVFGLTAPRAQRLLAVPWPRLSCPLFRIITRGHVK